MTNHEQQQARLLEEYCEALAHNLRATPPAELDAELVSFAQGLYRQAEAAEPSATFAWRLEQRLANPPTSALARSGQAGSANPAAMPHRFPLQSWLMPRLATAAMLALLVVGAALLAGILSGRTQQQPGPSGNTGQATATPQLPSIAEIAGYARKTLESGQIQSFVLTTTSTLNTELTHHSVWFASPNLWRIEETKTITQPDGTVLASSHTIEVSDGINLWDYNIGAQQVIVTLLASVNNPKGGPNPIEGVLGDGEAAYLLTNNVNHAKVVGIDTVAGRPAYVIQLDDSPYMADNIVTHTVWVDSQLYGVLKAERHQHADILDSSLLTAVQYNVEIDKAQFTFTPPPGATVKDFRNGDTNKQMPQQKLTQQLLEVAAKTLGMTPDELKNALAKGATLAELAKSKGISEQDLKTAVISAVKPGLDQMVQAGQLSQDEEDKLIGSIENTDLSKPLNLDSLGGSNATVEPVATPGANPTYTGKP
jgi:outer membrane lipoprotein-sorting protein